MYMVALNGGNLEANGTFLQTYCLIFYHIIRKNHYICIRVTLKGLINNRLT